MPSQREIARHLGFTQPRVCQLVKEGLPTNSFDAAEKWLKGRWLKRAPTNGKRMNWAIPHSKFRRRERKQPASTGNSLQDALEDAITVNGLAFNLFEEARVSGEDGRLGVMFQNVVRTGRVRQAGVG